MHTLMVIAKDTTAVVKVVFSTARKSSAWRVSHALAKHHAKTLLTRSLSPKESAKALDTKNFPGKGESTGGK